MSPALVIWAFAAALWFGTYAAGGADSFGYLSQARLFAHGRLTDTMPRHEGFDWPDVPATLTPLAYTRNSVPDVLVPVYPPGLSMMMAPLALVHSNAVFLLVPLCAALTVWLTIVLGRELNEPAAGVLGALLVAVSPTFVLQSVQPMSDVPVAALWLSALVLARRPATAAAILSGVVSSLAILVRPNLAPLATPPFYAIPIVAGDIGTNGGLRTNEHAQVLAESGEPIAGLYATGNTTASVMGHSYPGAGATLGPAMTFGFIAARHACGVTQR